MKSIELLNKLARVVEATEAARFAIVESDGGNIVGKVLDHRRPGDSSAEVRAAAVQAFHEIAMMCVPVGKDGAILVGSSDNGLPQYCLVMHCLWTGEEPEVWTFITRSPDFADADQKLATIQHIARSN